MAECKECIHDEYIERKALREYTLQVTGQSEIAFDMCYPFWQFSKCIKEVPAADVAPVIHGRVVTTSDRWHIFHQNCSECGADLPWKEYPNYCYNCGAKLDLEDKNNE